MITKRQVLILVAIVEEYVKTNEPVGSVTLTKREDLNYSSATIRNEMATLEELGYLEKTHTSSGRIPSEAGYRYYVDNLMELKKMKKSTQNLLISAIVCIFFHCDPSVIISHLNYYRIFGGSYRAPSWFSFF